MQIWNPYDKKWCHNDIITKQWKTTGKCGLPRKQTNYISFQRYWWELSKNVLFIEFEPLCRKNGYFCQILAFFTMPTHQIWACHVTQEANFEKFLLFLILHLLFGKVTKFIGEKLSTSEVISQKPRMGVKTPPSSTFRVTADVTSDDFQRYDLQRCCVENHSSVTSHCRDWLTSQNSGEIVASFWAQFKNMQRVASSGYAENRSQWRVFF